MFRHECYTRIQICQDPGKVFIVDQTTCAGGVQPPRNIVEVFVIVQVGANLMCQGL